MPRPPTRPEGAYSRSEIQKRYRHRRKQADAQLRQDNETLRRLVAGMVPLPTKAAAQQRLPTNGGHQVAVPELMVPEPIVPAATVSPDRTHEPSSPVDRPAFHPTEDFNRLVARQENLDLAIMVLRCLEHGATGTRDIATACQAEPLAVLRILSFLDDQGLVYVADHDGLWTTSPNALAELQHWLHQAGRSTIS